MNLWRIVDDSLLPASTLQPVFDHTIGPLSLILAMLGAYAMFPTVERMRESGASGTRWLWLAGGATAMGFGFWGMTWMAMVGFSLPVPFSYSLPWVFLSLAPAVVASAVAIAVIAVPSQSALRLLIGSTILSLGLFGLQLLVLESLVAPVIVLYRGSVLLRALVLGAGFTFIAMYVTRRVTVNSRGTVIGHLTGSMFLGTAAVGTHFACMGAAVFGALSPAVAAGWTVPEPFLIPAIAIGTLIVTGCLWIGSLVDRRLTEAATQARQARATFGAVTQSLPDAVLICGSDGRVVTVNPAGAAMFGYEAGELVGKNVAQLMPATAGQHFTVNMQGDVATLMRQLSGTRHVFANGGLRSDGSSFPVEITLQWLAGAAGGGNIACVVRDLTASWARNARTRRLVTAVASAEEAIVLMDDSGRIEYVNQSYERMTGYSFAEVSGRIPRRAAYDPDTHNAMWNAVRGSGGTWRGRVHSARKDGTPFVEDMTLTRVPGDDGQESSYVKISRDVTLEEQQNLERDRIMAAVENCADGIEIVDPGGLIMYANPVRQAILGKSLAELKGNRLESLVDLSVAPEQYAEIMRESLAGRPWQGLYSYGIPGKGVVVDHLSITPICDASGKPESYVLVRRDVTEQRRLEEDLARARKLESVGQLAAGIAHEINTPIQYVSDNIRFVTESFCNVRDLVAGVQKFLAMNPGTSTADLSALIADADVDFLLEEVPKALAQSADGCTRVATIVKAMKEFCHPGQEKTAVDLNHAISSTIMVASNEWKYVADVQTEFDAALPAVSCVAGEVNQVVLNLLVNAAHAIADVVHDGAKGTITVGTRYHDDWAEIRIRDTGGGIRPEIRDRIFDPFFTTKEVGKGTGQGLALAYDVVVNKHGGQILLESAVGTGSTFIIRLPIAPHVAASAKAA